MYQCMYWEEKEKWNKEENGGKNMLENGIVQFLLSCHVSRPLLKKKKPLK